MVVRVLSCNKCGKGGLSIKVRIDDVGERCTKCHSETENCRTFRFCSIACLLKHMKKVDNHDCSEFFSRTAWNEKKAMGFCYVCLRGWELTIDQVSEKDRKEMLEFDKSWKTYKPKAKKQEKVWCIIHQSHHKTFPKYKSCIRGKT